jgi:CRP-like cAMP-binding protein
VSVAREQLLAISHVITAQLHIDDKWAKPLYQTARFKTLDMDEWLFHAGERDTDLFFLVHGELSGAVLGEDDKIVTMMSVRIRRIHHHLVNK